MKISRLNHADRYLYLYDLDSHVPIDCVLEADTDTGIVRRHERDAAGKLKYDSTTHKPLEVVERRQFRIVDLRNGTEVGRTAAPAESVGDVLGRAIGRI